MPAIAPDSDTERLTVGEAERRLDQALREFPAEARALVSAVGVGYRDNDEVFIVTVPDLVAKARFEQRFPEERVNGLPVFIEISSIHTASRSVGFARDADPDLYCTRPWLGRRIARLFLGLRTVFAP